MGSLIDDVMVAVKHFLLLLSICGAVACSEAHAAEPPRPASQQEYWAQFDRKDWSAASAAAEVLVNQARNEPGANSTRLADALGLLGNAQLGNSDFVGAERSFTEALQLVQANSITGSSNLLTPLRGLGFTYAASARHEAAAPLLERALLIFRRTFGLFDLGQQGMLRQLAASLTHIGRTDEAARHMSYLLRVGERTYGAGDPRMLPLLNAVGDWYSDTGNFLAARQVYQHALQIVNKKLRGKDLAAVDILRGFARTYTQELHYATLMLLNQRERSFSSGDFAREEPKQANPRYLNDAGSVALERALQILDADPQRPAALHIATLLQMGDWFQIKQEPQKALTFYRRALAIEGAAPAESARAQLDFPVRVYYPTPQLAARSLYLTPEQSDERFVQLEFSVTSEGTVKNARIVEENATARQASEALDAIQAARFRPKFVDGEPVETPAMTFRSVFRTRKKNDVKDAPSEDETS